MHFVFLNQYYPPDVAPTGVMLSDLVDGLVRDGHEVTVLCAAGGYGGERQGTGGRSQESEVRDQRSEVRDQRSEVRGQRSEVRDQRSEVRSQEEATALSSSLTDNRQPTTDNSSSSPADNRQPTTDNSSSSSADNRQPTTDNSSSSSADNRQLTTDNSSPSSTDHRSLITDHFSPSPSSNQHSKSRIHRIGATRFGRGSMVGKLADYLSYYLGVAWRLLVMRPGPDRIVALTTPPYLSVLARVCSKLRGVDHAHWVMDLYPAVMVSHGMLREGVLPHRMLNALARWGIGGKRCAAVVTIGPCMADLLRRSFKFQVSSFKGETACGGVVDEENPARELPCHRRSNVERGTSNIQHLTLPPAMPVRATPDFSVASAPTAFNIQNSESPISWVPLWSGVEDGAGVSDAAVRELRERRGWKEDELVVMYSGNMGLGHRFGELLEVAKGGTPVGRDLRARPFVANGAQSEGDAPATCIRNPSIRFVFYGGGKRRGEIEAFIREHPEAPVELHDYVPSEMLGAHLRSADVHLASLLPEWTGCMVPSKLQGIFAAGRPVVFIGGADSSIGRWVAESGGGWVVAPGDVDGLLAAIGEASDPAERLARGKAARAYAALHFDRDRNVARIVEEMGGGRSLKV